MFFCEVAKDCTRGHWKDVVSFAPPTEAIYCNKLGKNGKREVQLGESTVCCEAFWWSEVTNTREDQPYRRVHCDRWVEDTAIFSLGCGTTGKERNKNQWKAGLLLPDSTLFCGVELSVPCSISWIFKGRLKSSSPVKHPHIECSFIWILSNTLGYVNSSISPAVCEFGCLAKMKSMRIFWFSGIFWMSLIQFILISVPDQSPVPSDASNVKCSSLQGCPLFTISW